jgi:TonB family protein
LLIALVLVAGICGRAPAQGTAGLRGSVTDSAGRPVPDVEVVISGAERATRSNDRGDYRVTGMSAGNVVVTARRLGFKAYAQPVHLLEGVEMRINIRLVASPEVLDAVAVVAQRQSYDARLSGFNARSVQKVGHFVTRERIDRANSTTLTDMLRELPGVKIGGMRNQGRAIRLRGASCPPLIFVDGFPATAGEFDVDMIDLQSVEGIEVYAGLGTIPAEFAGPRDLDRCGVIAIWSRPSRDRRAREVRQASAAPADASSETFTADQVDVVARLDSGVAGPVFPDSLHRARVGGRVVVEFVVDTLGEVDPGTFEVLASTHPLFTQAVQEALVVARFRPAVRSGRKVRQFIQMPFSFALSEPRQAHP